MITMSGGPWLLGLDFGINQKTKEKGGASNRSSPVIRLKS